MRCLAKFAPGILLLAVLVGCKQKESPQDLKEKTANATEAVKHDAKAVADGIREGWNRDKSVNLNTASKDRLMTLPGLTAAAGDRVIAGRPYGDPEDVVAKRNLSRTKYDKIADRLTTQNRAN